MNDIKEIIDFMNVYKEFINIISLLNEKLGESNE